MTWRSQDFVVRRYDIEPEHPDESLDFDEGQITMTISVNGKEVIRQHIRTPGLVAMVSRPDESGVRVYQISTDPAMVDAATGENQLTLEQWHREALGV